MPPAQALVRVPKALIRELLAGLDDAWLAEPQHQQEVWQAVMLAGLSVEDFKRLHPNVRIEAE